ncbi:sulfatase [Wenyingzhuangia sp. 1_MG-2023]|nr:sulfatase [Wenyingzhuangia sp. 1_MG-2023]
MVFFSSCRTYQISKKEPLVKSSPNVLFIMVDDLRPELGCYGASQVISPNIDKLASKAVLFNKAYCNVPVCGASRASILTGILPTLNRFVQYDALAEKDVPKAKTLPQQFKEAGYKTFSIGKVFHSKHDSEQKSWSEPAWRKYQEEEDELNYRLSLDPKTLNHLSKRGRGSIVESPDVDDWQYPDGQTALKTMKKLEILKDSGEPFFLACGFVRPHMPFYAPKKYWNLYNRDSIELADNIFRPKDAPKALHGSGELKNYYLNGMKRNSEEFHRVMKHGYLASVSYTDKLIGDVLSKLEDLNLDKNTIIVLWGDHGWHLGEHNFWGKHNTMNLSLKVPLMIKLPNINKGNTSNAIVESVDLYPTLCELTGVKPPETLQGKSFVKNISNPKLSFREYAYSRFLDGDAITTKEYSFTEYTGKKPGMMLYNLKIDPEENENIANKPENKEVVKQMLELIKLAKKRAIE